jgi:xylulokinase
VSGKLLLGYDVGTSSTKAVLLREDGTVAGAASAVYPVHTPHPGWVEQDPDDWWRACADAGRTAMQEAGASPADIAALAFSGQMQGTLPVDADGRPLTRCMIWLDARATAQAHALTRGLVRVCGYGPVRLLRWLWISSGAPSLTGTDGISRTVWLREERPELWARTHKILDVKDHLLFRATGRYVTSYDQGNLTWLMDTRGGRRCWSPRLMRLTGVPEERLPELVPSAAVVGPLTAAAAETLGLRAGTPVVAGAGDVCAMAVGTGAVEPGVMHLALGTGSWITAHVKRRAVDPLSYVATMCSAHPQRYVAVASQQSAGACLEWLRGALANGHRPSVAELDALLAQTPPGADGLLFLPWLTGERTPVDDQRARGGFANVGLNHSRAHLVRAVYEGIALNTRWALTKLERLTGYRATSGLRFAAGGARSPEWCQMLADVLDRPVLRMNRPELAAARGAALLAAQGIGLVPDFDALAPLAPVEGRFDPRPEHRARYDEAFGALTDYYRRNRTWFARRNETPGDGRP